MPLAAENKDRNTLLMTHGQAADRAWSRVRGLIGRPALQPGQGLWIVPSNGIHMLFMRFPIDAVYLDRDLRVVAVDADMNPWKVGRLHRGAHSVLELPVGTIASTATQVGDQIVLEREGKPMA